MLFFVILHYNVFSPRFSRWTRRLPSWAPAESNMQRRRRSSARLFVLPSLCSNLHQVATTFSINSSNFAQPTTSGPKLAHTNRPLRLPLCNPADYLPSRCLIRFCTSPSSGNRPRSFFENSKSPSTLISKTPPDEATISVSASNAFLSSASSLEARG